VLLCAAIAAGRARGTLSRAEEERLVTALIEIPAHVSQALLAEADYRGVAELLADARDVLYLGRGSSYPMALEGALKLKELSYIHAEGYAGGEMKHGPIALIDEKMPVVVLAPREPQIPYEKIVGNVEEVRARGGKVIAVVDEDDTAVASLADDVIRLPSSSALLGPIVTAVPLQLLAYHVADLRGTDVDQPRNLAKSVTVE